MEVAPRRLCIRVEGVVQGVGYRPFVYALATRLGLVGHVGNDTRGVFIEAEGPPRALDTLVAGLTAAAPPLARVDRVSTTSQPPAGGQSFTIVASRSPGERAVLVAPDAGICVDCRREMADPADRRHRYPFINCTNCGPRFSIVRSTPYDRARTTMAGFLLCAECAGDYADPADRRFHAQPVCCPQCGPRLTLLDGTGLALQGEPVAGAVDRLRRGEIVAVKGLGGFHLAADATDEAAVARLRARKHREERPFALMVSDLAAAGALGEVSDAEATLLTDVAAPIVLLRRRPGARVAQSVAPGSPDLGVMLAYTPLHVLLCAAAGVPLVMTSGNISDEPIAYSDDDALRRLAGLADAFLTSDRPIRTRVDDSVARVARGRPLMLRRSRGHVPRPVTVPWAFPRPVLACGPELKNTFCLATGYNAFVSHHIGDLENYETLQSYLHGITLLAELFDIVPEVIAYDLHPEYLSTKHALECTGELVGVQHHHAHIVSCLADNGVDGPVIGVAFDGLGWGEDGTLWGGEFLVATRAGYQRVAHLSAVPMPGGAQAVRQPWRMAAAHLQAAYGSDLPDVGLAGRHGRRWTDVLAMANAGVSSPRTSSMGRLFDAVASLVGVRDSVSYEGQAAVELEHLVDPAEKGSYPVGVVDGAPRQVCGADLIRAVVADVGRGVAAPVVAARFHQAVADLVVDVCGRTRRERQLNVVALSGGVFQNMVLLDRCVTGLTAAGFEVLTHRTVPPNDGGISLGQAVVAAARAG